MTQIRAGSLGRYPNLFTYLSTFLLLLLQLKYASKAAVKTSHALNTQSHAFWFSVPFVDHAVPSMVSAATIPKNMLLDFHVIYSKDI